MKLTTMIAAGLLALSTLPVQAAEDLSKGYPSDPVASMDTNKDKMISKEEFLKYQEAQFDKMKNKQGLVPAEDMFGYLKGGANAHN